MPVKDMWKQALMSILIGAAISFLTVLFQGIVDFLQNIPPEITGSLVGITRYITKWTSNRIV